MYRQIRTAPRGGQLDAVAVVLFEKTGRLPKGYDRLDRQVDGALSAAIRRPEFSAAQGTVTCLYPAKGPSRVHVLGLGTRERFNRGLALRVAAARLARVAHKAALRGVRLALGPGLGESIDPEAAGRAVADGLAIANFEFDEFKGAAGLSTGPSRHRQPARLGITIDSAMLKGLKRGLEIGESVNLARYLGATPPNVANPAWLVSACRRMARRVGLRCTIIDHRRAARLKMGGLLAVGAAGSKPPALICLEWPGRGKGRRPGGSKPNPILLVGKAVTFDTGGYSIKPAAGMDTMKYDKCGGMAVIGAMHAAARLKLPVRVVGLVPTAENMIDEKGYRPSDILRLCNGTTVEVTNTDAEGRLILGDALAYGCKTYKPKAVIDLATLTGGVVVALGTLCAGAFCNDERLRGHLFDAADYTGERLWQLPLWEEHKSLLKSTHADIVNSGGREAHPIQGAAFLWHFVDPKIPWAHLDIAGVSDVKNPTDLFPKGPTGFGVRLLTRALETWK